MSMVKGTVVPHRVSPRPFNLDDISAQIGENLGAENALLISEIQHPEIAEKRFFVILLNHLQHLLN